MNATQAVSNAIVQAALTASTGDRDKWWRNSDKMTSRGLLSSSSDVTSYLLGRATPATVTRLSLPATHSYHYQQQLQLQHTATAEVVATATVTSSMSSSHVNQSMWSSAVEVASSTAIAANANDENEAINQSVAILSNITDRAGSEVVSMANESLTNSYVMENIVTQAGHWLWQFSGTDMGDLFLYNSTFNNGAISTDENLISFDIKYSLWQATLIVIIIGIVILFIVLGNGLVILAIAVDRNLSQVQNYFIASLAVSDLLLGLLVMPLSLTYELTDHWFFGDIVCDLWLSTDVLLCTASILNLCLISLDRYWSITRAVSYAQYRTVRRAMIMIAVVWGLSMMICLPPLAGWKRPFEKDDEIGRKKCALSSEKGYVAYSALGSFYIPLIVMIVVYVKIYFAARSRARRNLKKKSRRSGAEAAALKKHQQKMSISIEVPLKSTATSLILPAVADETTWVDYETTCWEQAEEQESLDTYNKLVVRDDSRQPLTDDASNVFMCSSIATSPMSPIEINGSVGFEKLSNGQCSNHQTYNEVKLSNSPERCQWLLKQQQHQNQADIKAMQPLISNELLDKSMLQGSSQRSVTAGGATNSKTRNNAHKSKLTREYIMSALKVRRTGNELTTATKAVPSIEEERQRAKRQLAKQRERRATIVLGIVMVTFTLCWLPFFITYPIATFAELKVPAQLFAVFFWAGYCNSAMNPLIYTIFNREFRHAFQRVLHIRRPGP